MSEALTPAPRRTPRLIGWVFGALWALIAIMALPRPARLAAAVLTAVCGIAFLVRLWGVPGHASAQRPFFRTRGYVISVVLEAVALSLVSATFPRHGLAAFVYPAVGVIVGLHFIGLWKASGSRRLLAIAAGMCVVSCVSALLPTAWAGLNPRLVLLGFGNALVLWFGASRTE